MSCSGGEASIIADSAEKRKVYFPDLTTAQVAPLQAALGPLVAIANPLDYHTYSWGNREVMQATYSSMVSIGFDMNYLILDFPHPTRCDDWEWHIAVDAFEELGPGVFADEFEGHSDPGEGCAEFMCGRGRELCPLS